MNNQMNNRFWGSKYVIGMLLGVGLLGLVFSPAVFASTGLTTTELSSSLTSQDLVNALVGPGIEVKNINYTGVSQSAGTFSGGASIIGFDSGIILSSGYVSNVIGPNLRNNTTASLGLPGDVDLDGLAGSATLDATTLEFDFKPIGKTLIFDYVLGSEEYNEFANSPFNDVFGFFLNGVNIALLPDGVTPVSINNVNGGSPFGTNPKNPGYYRNNDLQEGGGSINTELDGLTTVLSLNANVTPGVWYHIKLAIADVGDSLMDSDVFIRAGSFASTDLSLKPNEATNKIGEPHSLTATYMIDNEPVQDVLVHFEVISGPNTGTGGNSLTNASGIATWSYTGTEVGIDKIKASLVGEPTIVSNTVTKIWQDTNPTPTPTPGPEVGGVVYQVNKPAIFIPLIVLITLVLSGIIIVMKRRRVHS